MVKDEYVLAFDVGTTSTKGIAVNVSTGRIEASVTHNHSTLYIDQHRIEQNASHWWQGIIYTTRNILYKLGVSSDQIIGMGITGQTPNCLSVDKNGVPLRNAMTHMDTRSFPIIEKLRGKIDEKELLTETGARLDPRVDYSRILWLKENETNTYKATYKFLQAKDYIVFKLTGEFVTDYTDASLGYGLLNIEGKKYSKKMLNLLNIDEEKLPRPVPSTYIVGRLTKGAAEVLKLKVDIPVIAGACDVAAVVLGCGVSTPGSILMYLGGSIFTIIISDINIPSKHRFVQVNPDLLGYPIDLQTGGICYEWIKDNIFQIEHEVGKEAEIYKVLDNEAEKVVDSQGLIFLPYLAGGPSVAFNPNVRGLFYGLSISHTRAHLLRAVMEGIAFEFKMMVEHLESVGLKTGRMHLIGGGSKSVLWCNIIANILGREVFIPMTAKDAAAYGVALTAMVSLGRCKDFTEVQRLVKVERSYKPNLQLVRKYINLYNLYKKIGRELLTKIVG